MNGRKKKNEFYQFILIGTPKKKGSADMSKDYRRQTSMKELPQFQTQTPYKRGNERRNSVAGESMNDEEMEESNQSKKVVHEKSEEARKRIAEITVNNLLIRNLDRHQKEGFFLFFFFFFFILTSKKIIIKL